MLIGLNGQRLLTSEPAAGPEKYTYNIYKALAGVDKVNKYIIYFSDYPSNAYIKDLTQNNNNFSFKVLRSRISWTQVALAKQLFKDKLDVFFTPVHTMPIIRPAKAKYVSMIHGLEFKYSDPKNILQKVLIGKPELYNCVFSDKIIVPSKATKKDVIKRRCTDEKSVTVVYEGVGENFYKRPADEVTAIKKKLGIDSEKYFLFIGTIQPRKNLPATISAFATLSKENPAFEVQLVVVGKQGWKYEESLNAPKKYGIEDKVKFLGRVSDEDLPGLISGAASLTNFSLQEGFGLPLLEAMACETPCVVSNIPPYKEVCEDLAYYANPSDIQDMKEKMLKILTNNNKELILKAKERAADFLWDKSAKETLSVFEDAVKNPQSRFRVFNPTVVFKILVALFN